jgi:hypothetical protein
VVSRMSAGARSGESARDGSPSAGSVDTIRTQDIGPSASRCRAKTVGRGEWSTLPNAHRARQPSRGGKAGGGGGVRLMLELGTGLVNRGHRVTVACHDFLPGSEFSYAADQLEIRSVRRGTFELPVGNRALARRFWLDMPKVARLVPPEANVVNAPTGSGFDPGASPPDACRSRSCGLATTNRSGSARSCRSRRSPASARRCVGWCRPS